MQTNCSFHVIVDLSEAEEQEPRGKPQLARLADVIAGIREQDEGPGTKDTVQTANMHCHSCPNRVFVVRRKWAVGIWRMALLWHQSWLANRIVMKWPRAIAKRPEGMAVKATGISWMSARRLFEYSSPYVPCCLRIRGQCTFSKSLLNGRVRAHQTSLT